MSILENLEQNIFDRDPSLAAELLPGLSKKRVQGLLQRAGVTGYSERLTELYTWKNGVSYRFTPLGSSAFEKKLPSILPKNEFYFRGLQYAIADYQALSEVSINFPIMKEAVGRYFPIFWNGDVSWLATDLKNESNRIVFLNWNEKNLPFPQIYLSFKDLVVDLTRVQSENIELESIKDFWENN